MGPGDTKAEKPSAAAPARAFRWRSTSAVSRLERAFVLAAALRRTSPGPASARAAVGHVRRARGASCSRRPPPHPARLRWAELLSARATCLVRRRSTCRWASVPEWATSAAQTAASAVAIVQVRASAAVHGPPRPRRCAPHVHVVGARGGERSRDRRGNRPARAGDRASCRRSRRLNATISWRRPRRGVRVRQAARARAAEPSASLKHARGGGADARFDAPLGGRPRPRKAVLAQEESRTPRCAPTTRASAHRREANARRWRELAKAEAARRRRRRRARPSQTSSATTRAPRGAATAEEEEDPRARRGAAAPGGGAGTARAAAAEKAAARRAGGGGPRAKASAERAAEGDARRRQHLYERAQGAAELAAPSWPRSAACSAFAEAAAPRRSSAAPRKAPPRRAATARRSGARGGGAPNARPEAVAAPALLRRRSLRAAAAKLQEELADRLEGGVLDRASRGRREGELVSGRAAGVAARATGRGGGTRRGGTFACSHALPRATWLAEEGRTMSVLNVRLCSARAGRCSSPAGRSLPTAAPDW